jgi:hypothetical protein
MTMSVAMPSESTECSRGTNRLSPLGGVVLLVVRVVVVGLLEDAGRADCGDIQRRGTTSLQRVSLYRARRVGEVADDRLALSGVRNTVPS